jgi:hypothetical protein
MSCGEVKTITGSSTRLVCNLDAGHALPHGVREFASSPPWVRWPVVYAPDVEQLAARAAWHKPHVRRTYTTLAIWKAAN